MLPYETELRIGKSRRDAADVSQLALVIKDAEQQCIEERTRPSRLGPSADDACMNHGMLHYAACALLRARAVVFFARAGVFFFPPPAPSDRKSTRLNSSHGYISYAVF